MLEERLRDAVAFCRQLQGDAGEPLATDLGPIGDASARSPTRSPPTSAMGRVSRFAKPAARAPSGPAEGLGSLRSRARRIRGRGCCRARGGRGPRSAGEPRSRRRRMPSRSPQRGQLRLARPTRQSNLRPCCRAAGAGASCGRSPRRSRGPERSDASGARATLAATPGATSGCERRVGRCKRSWTLAHGSEASWQRAWRSRAASAPAASARRPPSRTCALQSGAEPLGQPRFRSG